MNVGKVLENYNEYKARIVTVNAQIRELKSEILEVKSANLDGMPKPKGFVTSNIDDFIIQKEEKISQKQKYIDKLKDELSIVEALVKILKRYNQDVIELRFYNKLSIEEIATRKERTYSAIQKTIDASISEMQQEYDKTAKKV